MIYLCISPLTLDLLTALLALNVDLNLNCLHLLASLRTVQRHRSAPIRVLCDPVRYINLLVVVVVVVVVDASKPGFSFIWFSLCVCL